QVTDSTVDEYTDTLLVGLTDPSQKFRTLHRGDPHLPELRTPPMPRAGQRASHTRRCDLQSVRPRQHVLDLAELLRDRTTHCSDLIGVDTILVIDDHLDELASVRLLHIERIEFEAGRYDDIG